MMNNNGKMVEVPFFVGYNMAENGFGKAMIKEWDEQTVTLALCGDDEIYDDFFVMSKDDYYRNMRYMRDIISKVGLENIAN